MASTDARPVPIKNTAYRHYFCIRKSDGSLITSWTAADTELSLDGAAFSDATNEATEIGTTGCGYIDLTSGEMNADAVMMKTTVTNTGALTYVVTFFPEETGDINVDVTAFGGSAGTFSGGRPEVNTTHIAGSAVSTSSAQIGVNVVNAGGTAWASGAITAASIASDAITADKIANGAIDAATFAADVDAEILSYIVDDATRIDASSLNTASVTTIPAIVADTNELQTDWVNGGRLDLIVDAILDDTGTSGVALASNSITAGVIADGAIDRATFAADTGLQPIHSGTAQAGSSSTITLDASASATNDVYVPATLLITGGTGAGQHALIQSYVGATKVATLHAAWKTNPDNTSTFAILPHGMADVHLINSQTVTAAAPITVGAYVGGTAAAALETTAQAILDDTGTSGVVVASGSKTGYSLVSTGLDLVTAWTVAITGNITGNLSGSVGSVTGAVGSVTGSVGSVTGNVGGNVTGSVGSLATQAKADVNAEVLDVLATDTFAEPSAVVAATSSLKDKINWIFSLLRNKRTQTASTETLFRDDGSTTTATSTKSDDGTTLTRGEWT